jgi:TolB-like protein
MGSSRHSRADPPVSSFEEPRSRLDSWKQIAAYLGRSEKTVRRWEETARLPVHRLNHEKRPSVYAYTNELERWRETRRSAVEGEPEVADDAAESNNEASLPRFEPDNKTSRPGKGRHSWLIAFLMAIIFGLGLLVGGYWGRLQHLSAPGTSIVRIQSVAVLPFKNISSNLEQEYFADGLTDELITELARTRSVRVISRTSVMRYKDTNKSVSEITKELDVDAVVQGAVVRSGGRLRLSVQLVTASPERHLWADSYEGDIRDVLELQRKVARDVGSKIGAKLIPAASSRPEKRLNPETYETYLRARHFLAMQYRGYEEGSRIFSGSAAPTSWVRARVRRVGAYL